MFNDREARQIASAICNAAKQINDTLERMIGDLPQGASAEMAMQCLAVELSDSQPVLTRAMMESEQAEFACPPRASWLLNPSEHLAGSAP
jgi:hypothetical protein